MASSPPPSILGLLEGALRLQDEKLRLLAARASAGGDDELVHDVRVTLRRFEALGRLFRDFPGEGDGRAARAMARTLRRRLSELRSEEVGRALLAGRTGGTGGRLEALAFPGALPAVRVGAAEVVKIARAATSWRRRLASAVEGPFAPRALGEAIVIRRTRRRLLRLLADLSALLPPRRKTLHPARIAAKRLRYALEAVEPLDPDARPLLRLLRAFQDAAGDAHDLAELAARTRAALAGVPDPGPGDAAIADGLETDAARTLAAARRRGEALARPVRSFRPALGAPGTR